MPFKVFGIGSQKTGTTTLGACLRALGFTPHAGRPERRVIRAYARDPATALRYAEGYRSFQDAPWCFGELYRDLDLAFPSSRFILTERDADRWWSSFVRYKTPPGRGRSDIRYRFRDPWMATLMHRLAWGVDYERSGKYSMEPYEERYREVYLGRNLAIRGHFAHRPNDLLLVDWERGDGWRELCAFLDRPVPDQPMPHLNLASGHPEPIARVAWTVLCGVQSLLARGRRRSA